MPPIPPAGPPPPAPHPPAAVEVVGTAGEAAAVEAALRRDGGGAAGRRVVVVGGPVAERAAAARAAVAGGADVFVAWPPGSVAEAEGLLRRAEEAGVEVGVERPLAAPAAVRAAGPARIVVVTLAGGGPWPRRLAGALDVCARLAGSREPARLDAEADRDGAALRALAVTVRFRNGALAQALLRDGPRDGSVTVYAAGAPGAAGPEASGPAGGDPFGEEAAAFVRAGRPAPYPLDDALATMRLAERVMAALR